MGPCSHRRPSAPTTIAAAHLRCDPVAAGRTSLVLTNEGAEAHFMGLFKLAAGHTVDEVIQYEGLHRIGLGR